MAATLLLGESRLQAGPPLVTDDPGTPGACGYEFNLAHVLVKTRDQTVQAAPFIELNYGPSDNAEMTISANVISIGPEGEDSHWGLGDLQLAYKYRFWDEAEHGLDVAVAPRLFAPTGQEDFGIGAGQTQMLLPMEFGRHLDAEDKFYLYGEVAYLLGFENSDNAFWYFGVAFDWQMTDKFCLVGEVGLFDFQADVDDPFFNLGARYELTDHVALLFAAGRSFEDASQGKPEFQSYAGLQITWGGATETHRLHTTNGLPSDDEEGEMVE